MNKLEEISLDEFVEQESRRLAFFKSYYESNHKHNPENWPLAINSGAWGEFFAIFDPADADKIEHIPPA